MTITLAAFAANAARAYASMIGDDLPRAELLAQQRVNDYIDTLPTEAPHLRQMVIETRRAHNIERSKP